MLQEQVLLQQLVASLEGSFAGEALARVHTMWCVARMDRHEGGKQADPYAFCRPLKRRGALQAILAPSVHITSLPLPRRILPTLQVPVFTLHQLRYVSGLILHFATLFNQNG